MAENIFFGTLIALIIFLTIWLIVRLATPKPPPSTDKQARTEFMQALPPLPPKKKDEE
jgi:hypothetical protein